MRRRVERLRVGAREDAAREVRVHGLVEFRDVAGDGDGHVVGDFRERGVPAFFRLFGKAHRVGDADAQLFRRVLQRDDFLEDGEPGVERLVEGLFLDADGLAHGFAAGTDFRERVAHRVGEHVDELVEEGFAEAERAAVAHGAPQDAPQHVVAVAVARRDAVGDGE